MIIGLVYAVPIFVLYAIIYGSIIMAALSGSTGQKDSAEIAGWAPNIGHVLLMILVEIAVGVIVPVSLIRPARTNSFYEAFNIGTILGYIGKIGWIHYIIALILINLVREWGQIRSPRERHHLVSMMDRTEK